MTDELPKGWTTVELSEVAEVRLGRQRSPKNHTGDNMRPYLRAANVGRTGLLLDYVKEMHFSGDECATYELQQGDVVLSEASGSVGEVGKPAIWRGEIPGCCFQNTLIRVRSREALVPEFILFRLRLEALNQSWAAGTARGVGIHHLGSQRLSRWTFALPPVSEQQRIVEEVERRLSHVNTADRWLALAQRKVATARAEIIKQAVPEEWPEHWLRMTVNEAGRTRLGLQRSPDRHTGTDMRRYLRVANVREARIDLTDVMEMNFNAEERQRYRLEPGDILLNEGQSPEFLGRPAMWTDRDAEMYFTNSLIRFRAGESVLPSWALLVFRRHMYAGRFRKESRITTNIAHLALGRFRTVEFPVPPVDEQAAVVEEVDRRLSLLAVAGRDIEEGLRRVALLRRSILAAAFSGELVPQDPNDEPADVLLERIRAERAAAQPQKKTRTKRKESVS